MSDYSNETSNPRPYVQPPYVQPNVTINPTPKTPARSNTPGLGIALIVIAAFVVIAIMWATMSANRTVVDPTDGTMEPAVTAPAVTDAPVMNDTATDPAVAAPANDTTAPAEGAVEPVPVVPAPAPAP